MQDSDWKPFTLNELHTALGDCSGWFVDGGEALDLFLGQKTREHGDLDIGVLTSFVPEVLSKLTQQGFQVFIANRQLQPLATEINPQDYNYWISDGQHYKLQILVYAVQDERVYFRRNPEISWPLEELILEKNGIELINPLVSYAFKVTCSAPQPKDLQDIAQLSHWVGQRSA